MVQALNNINQPTYNAVKIKIKNPEVNTNSTNPIQNKDNGIYNAISIDIDNPKVKSEPQKTYDYPEAKEPVYYDMAQINPIELPKGFSFAYQTTNVILPNLENEIELNKDDNDKSITIPEPNYTTVEAENKFADILPSNETGLNFKGKVESKKPEIIPGEEIKPDLDIPLIISNLRSNDYDTQAQQMEEIARLSLDPKENVVPFLVRDIFDSLIQISKKDTSKLETPTVKQIEARNKLIANFLAIENAQNNNTKKEVPFKLTEEDFQLANTLSPMELAERNKEYSLYTIAILAKTYADEIEKKTGDIIPITDLPGSAAIVDALRYNQNSGVKIAAIDSLRHIQRPEYKEELKTLYTIAKADPNPQVSNTATQALYSLE